MGKGFKTISLFSGCGGLDLGFEAAGYDIVFASDIMPEACETLKANFKNTVVFGPPEHTGNIADLTGNLIRSSSRIGNDEVDMIVGGPPCQPFSVAAAQRFLKSDERFKRRGFECDEKGQLIFEYLRLIQELNPKAFLIENVPGLLKMDKGKTVEDLRSVLSSLGYKTNVRILDAMDFGVPQTRKRTIIVGNRLNVDFEFPTGEYGNGLLNKNRFNTVAQALVDIPNNAPNYETRDHKDGSVERYRTLKAGQREPLGRVDRLNPDKPSKTVIAGGSKGGGRSHLHPFLARTLSVRECARLQTFPDDFVFLGKVARQFTQVGNAVPPLLGEVLAREIARQVFGIKNMAQGPTLLPKFKTPNEASSILLSSAMNEKQYKLYFDICNAKKIALTE